MDRAARTPVHVFRFPVVLAALIACAALALAGTAPARGLYTHDVRAPAGADVALEVRARFTNGGRGAVEFVPLLVLADARGRELREDYASPLRLEPDASGDARFHLRLDGVAAGHYFIAVLPSHPDTGKRVGEGVYRVPLKVRCCARGGRVRARP